MDTSLNQWSDEELKIKRGVLIELATFANLKRFPDRDEEEIIYFEDRLIRVSREIEKRASMDANHQTRLFIGGD